MCGAVGDEGEGGFAALLIRDTPDLGHRIQGVVSWEGSRFGDQNGRLGERLLSNFFKIVTTGRFEGTKRFFGHHGGKIKTITLQ